MDAAAGVHARGDRHARRLRRAAPPLPPSRARPRRAGSTSSWSRCAPSATAWSSSLSRIVAAGAARRICEARTRATAARVRPAARPRRVPGATGAALFDAAADAYAAAGFPGEELRHHQGGAIGYRAREWVAHPKSQETVQARQAFAWNPTITGTKVEDTALVIDDRIELLTSTPDWPGIAIDARGSVLEAADVWRMG